MGIFTTYLAYRAGRRRAERKAHHAEVESCFDEVDPDEICDSCGHRLAQHSDDDPPLCPRY